MQYECIRNCNVDKEEENVLVKFSTPVAAAVISSELITSIHSTHELVVEDNTLRARYGDPRAISYSPKHCTSSCWLSVAGHDGNDLPVHPCRSRDVTILLNQRVTSVTIKENRYMYIIIIPFTSQSPQNFHSHACTC